MRDFELAATAQLKAEGCTVTVVEDGLSALYILEVHRADVIVLNLALPRLSGRELFREIKARPTLRGIPVVDVTGTDSSDLDRRDFAAIL